MPKFNQNKILSSFMGNLDNLRDRDYEKKVAR